MAFWATLTTARAPLDPVAVNVAIKAATGDPTAVLVLVLDGTWRAKKNAAAWAPADLVAAQAILDTSAPLVTSQLLAQEQIDGISIELKALILALIDQLNIIRAALPVPIGPITPGAAVAAIRTKAGTL